MMGAFDDLIPVGQSRAPDDIARVTVRPQDKKPDDLGDFADLVPEKKPDMGRLNAFITSLGSGATGNWSDELKGVQAASGLPMSMSMGGIPGMGATAASALARLGYEMLTGEEGEATKAYKSAKQREQEAVKTAREQYPGTSIAGEMAGAVAVPIPGMAAARGVGGMARAARSAGVGAGFGAVSGAGEGEGLADRATRAATGGVIGGFIGGAVSPVADVAARGIGGAAREAGRYMFPNVEARATRMVDNAAKSSQELDPNALRRLTNTEVAATPEARVIDMAGDRGRDVARWAANASPEARETLNAMIDPRFAGQGARVTGWLDHTFNFPNAQTQQEAIDTTARTVNRWAYARAHREGSEGLWSPELERLAGSDAVSSAMQSAAKKAKDEAIVSGHGAMNPRITFTPDGRMEFNKGPTGVPTYPDLQYWDLVRRELSDAAQNAGRGTSEARRLNTFATSLNAELDNLVPAYQQARQGAAQFFGAENALEAGKAFVTSKMQNREARVALAKMNPLERQLFQDGFVSKYIEKLRELGDNRNILNQITQAPAARERLQIALGPQKSAELETMLRVEGIMDFTRPAVKGNSTTARQLVELGVIGSYGGLGSVYGQDPSKLAESAIFGAFALRGRNTDQRVARRVAELLVSRDPAQLQKGLQIVSRNQGMMDALRGLDQRIARVAGEQNVGASMVPQLQGPAGIRAEQEQP